MKKNFLFFLVVGLTFTALQFATVAAQTGMPGGQCDPNPACDPTSGTCCGQCDPGPACVMDDPNAIPCCGAAGDPNASGMPGMGDHQGDNNHCAKLHPGGAAGAQWRRRRFRRGAGGEPDDTGRHHDKA